MSNSIKPTLKKNLSENILPVKAADNLTIGILVSSTSIKKPEVLDCHIQFLNSQDGIINTAYQGCLYSQETGPYVEMPVLTNQAIITAWSQQSIVVPARARKVILTITSDQHSESKTLGPIYYVNTERKPILNRVYDLISNNIYSFQAFFRNAAKASNIALLSVRYFDHELKLISDEVIGLSRSDRYGYFKYLHCDQNGHSTKVILIPPEKSAYVHLQVHPLIEDYSLEFSQTAALDIEPDLTVLFYDPEWVLISPDKIEPVQLATTNGKNELIVATLAYISTTNNDRPFGTITLKPNDSSEASPEFGRKFESSNELYGTNYHIIEQRCYFENISAAGNKNLLFVAKENALGFIKKDVKVISLFQSKDDTQNVISTEQTTSYTFDALPYWTGAIHVKIESSNTPISLAWELCWLDQINSVIASCSGSIRKENGKALRVSFKSREHSLHAHSIGSERSENQQLIIEFRPPGTATKGVFTLRGLDADDPLSVAYRIEPFAHLELESLGKDAIEDSNFLESTSRSALTRTLNALVQKYPANIKILSTSFDYYNRVENQVDSTLVAKKILNIIKDPLMCKKVRSKLALMRVLHENWLPLAYRENRKNVRKPSCDRDKSKLKIAVLSGENSSYQESIPLKILIENGPNNWEISRFVVVSFASLAKGKGNTSYESEIVNGVQKYYINCIDPIEIDNLPVDCHLNFISLLASKILCLENPDAIYVTIGQSSLLQLLLGSALARKFDVPLFLETTVHPQEAIWDDGEDSFSNAQISKIYKCIGEADTVFTYSKEMTDDFIMHNVPAQKIISLESRFSDDNKCEDIGNSTSEIISMFLNSAPTISDLSEDIPFSNKADRTVS